MKNKLTPEQLAEIREWNEKRNTFCHAKMERLLDHITALEADNKALRHYYDSTLGLNCCDRDLSSLPDPDNIFFTLEPIPELKQES